MKKHIRIAVLFACLCVQVDCVIAVPVDPPVSFDFQAVTLVSVLQMTYKNLLHRDYVISPAVLVLDKRVSMSVKALPLDSVGLFVDGILAGEGIGIRKHEDGVYYVSVLERESLPVAAGGAGSDGAAVAVVKENELVKLYRPDNRTVDFMVTVINAAFGGAIARPAGSLVALSAAKDRMVSVLQLARAVDELPRSVEVSASFVEVTTSSTQSSGLSLAARVLGVRFGASVGSGAGGAFSISTGSFQLVLDALAADGRFRQVSNSRVVGDESERVNLSVGDETPTLQSSGRDNLGNALQSIVYRSSGVILDVLPKVLGGGRLSLVVDGQVSSFKATTTGVTGSPTLSKRQVKTAVTVGDGEVLLIGGLDESSAALDTSGFSFLPVAWRGSSGSQRRSELILVLSARSLARN